MMATIGVPPCATALTPTDFLRRSATIFPDRVAVIDGADRTSYIGWYHRVRRMAGLLRKCGVQQGDCVAVLAPNTSMLLDAHYGVPMAGAVLLTLNIRLTVEDLTYISRHAGAKAVLFDDSLAHIAAQLPIPIQLSATEYRRRVADAPEVEHQVDDELALLSLNYTSGTTGRPRGVMYHHRGAYLQALATAYHSGLSPQTVHLWTLPMFHCHGWSFTWSVTAAGGTHVCLPKVEPSAIWRHLHDDGVNSLNAAPTVLIDLASHHDARRVAHGVRVGTGGAPPSPTLLQRLSELGFDITHYYGLTETYGPAVICEFPAERADSPMIEQARFKARQGNCNIVGQPLRVVDDRGDDVPADATTMGEIVIRGNTVATGYYRDEEATREAFGSGWFRTGDLGVMHPDNYVELRDRAKDVIISGGENISSVEVEQVLDTHPAVRECAVVAGPHPRWGEVPVAFVDLEPGANATVEDLIAYARTRLPGFKTPKTVYIGPLPKTGTGKIQKFRLRDRARHGKYSSDV
ncbi:AMP-dependent synthetase and ligase [Mycolicibacterium thermoresistibile]|nr:AMP-dependent synthetase and ligase [Mycolicibacterium thermoresistibile]